MGDYCTSWLLGLLGLLTHKLVVWLLEHYAIILSVWYLGLFGKIKKSIFLLTHKLVVWIPEYYSNYTVFIKKKKKIEREFMQWF